MAARGWKLENIEAVYVRDPSLDWTPEEREMHRRRQEEERVAWLFQAIMNGAWPTPEEFEEAEHLWLERLSWRATGVAGPALVRVLGLTTSNIRDGRRATARPEVLAERLFQMN